MRTFCRNEGLPLKSRAQKTIACDRGGDTPFREVFLFVAGSTPQIITETIFALSRQTPPVLPDEIVIITTAVGERVIRKNLLVKRILAAMQSECGLPPIPLSAGSFIVPRLPGGKPLADVRTAEDNAAMGETIFATVREKTSDPERRLHCSLAGGRKTMSFYLGSAMQLFGRKQDRLYHVLVAPQYESRPDFFYPAATLPVKKPIVELAELPFLRFRGKLMLDGSDPAHLMAAGQEAIDHAVFLPDIHVNLAERTVRAGDVLFALEPALLTVYTAFLLFKRSRCTQTERATCRECTGCFVGLDRLEGWASPEPLAEIYRRIYRGRRLKADDCLIAHKDGVSAELLRQYISKINRRIRDGLPDETVRAACLIRTVRKYGASRYGVALDRQKIHIT